MLNIHIGGRDQRVNGLTEKLTAFKEGMKLGMRKMEEKKTANMLTIN
jgi:hypothetical protein